MKPKLLDHLVGTGEQLWRHVEAERLGGLQVHGQLVFGRRLHRQVGGLLALEDAIYIAGGAPVLIEEIRPVGYQPPGRDEEAFEIDRRQFVTSRQRDDQIAMNIGAASFDHLVGDGEQLLGHVRPSTGSRSYWLPGHRYSTDTFCPSTKPTSPSPWRNAVM